MKIYSHAREIMKTTGNPNQWGNNRPAEATIVADIKRGESFLMEIEGQIYGVFTFIIGDDPTYLNIENGAWLNPLPYGTIHRLAGNGKTTGLFSEALSFCEKLIPNIRIDTHHDNKIMQHLIEKNGFIRCGTIFVEDGSPRIAYQKCTRK